ncbi:DoxX family protein [Oceanicaulis sp. AH-315-P02]|nr:DoxX family protein [Robiginitomaculum sp.]MBN4047823.1 DoxX family protein [Oceanicaulis sp. AH-315-P02]
MGFLDKFEGQIYAIFRIVFGVLFMAHGVHKFFNFPTPFPYTPLTPLTITAGAIELVAGILIAIGFFTRPAAFLSSGLMAVAYWMAHGSKGLYPITNGGELAILFSFAFLYIAAKGAGQWAIDKK